MSNLERYYLKDNPFDIFSHEHNMADRKDVWDTITKSLESAFSGKGPRYFVVLGDYGVGKTYMLERVFKWVSKEQTDVLTVYSRKDVFYERRLALMESEPKWSKFGLDLIMRIFDNIEPAKLTSAMKKAKLDKTSKFKVLFAAISQDDRYAFTYIRGEKIPATESKRLGVPPAITDSPSSLTLFFEFLVAIKSAGYSSLLILVDEFEYLSMQGEKKITQVLNTFRKIFDDFGDYAGAHQGQVAKPIFVFATSPGGWDRLKELQAAAIKKTGGAGIAPFMERVSPKDMITLQPFSFENTLELVQFRLAEARSDPKKAIDPLFPFTREAIYYVHEVSFNKPRNVIQCCSILLEDALEKNLNLIDSRDAATILYKYGISSGKIGDVVIMPSSNDLISLLAGVRVNERDQSRAVTVAGHLVASVLENRWHALSERQRQQLVKPSTKRLWDSYMHMRKNLGQPPKEAAKQAIAGELALLREALNPNQKY